MRKQGVIYGNGQSMLLSGTLTDWHWMAVRNSYTAVAGRNYLHTTNTGQNFSLRHCHNRSKDRSL